MKKWKGLVLLILVLGLVMSTIMPAVTVNAEKKRHEVYTLKDRNSVKGLMGPADYASRASIYKALPKTKRTGKLTIGWVEATLSNPYFVTLIESAKTEAKKYGYTLKVLNAETDVTKMVSNMEDLISQKVDAIVLDPVDVQAAIQLIKKATDAGIPVIGVGGALDHDCNIVTSILANNFLNGWEVGQFAGTQFKGKHIKGFAIIGKYGFANSESRVCGELAGIVFSRMKEAGNSITKEDAMLKAYYLMKEYIKNGKIKDAAANFEFSGISEGSWTDEGGLKAAEDLLTAMPDANLVLCEQDFMALGAIKAIKARNLKLGKDGVSVIAAADGSRQAMEAIKTGDLLATGYNSAAMLGYAIDLIHMIFSEGYNANNMSVATMLPIICINKSNVNQYYDPKGDFCKPTKLEFKTLDQLLKEQK